MDTFLSAKGFLLLTLVATTSLRVNGCLNKSKPRSGQYQSTLFLDYLEELLKDDDTSTFADEARSLRETDAPTIQDLTSMFNDIDTGEFPQYMEDKNYTLLINFTSTYNYSTTNSGTVITQGYGTVKSQGNVATSSFLEFAFIQGSVGTFNYTAGKSFYTHTSYIKGKSSTHFQTSLLASTLFKMPGGIYVSTGNFTGIGQGNAVSYSKDVVTSVKTLGIIHTAQYYSKNIMTVNDIVRNGTISTEFNMISLSGGTNTTLNINTPIYPQAEEGHFNINGTLENSGHKATVSSEMKDKIMIDLSEPFSDMNLLYYSSKTRLGADIYLN